jgi:hypothetical protein
LTRASLASEADPPRRAPDHQNLAVESPHIHRHTLTTDSTLLRFAEAIAAAHKRFNRAIEARLPSVRGRTVRHPEAAYGLTHLFCALGGTMMLTIGLIGLVMSL